MEIDEVIEFVAALDGVLTLKPGPGDGTPEIAWGDAFFYYAPDGVVPKSQPFATVVTKDYPDDAGSRLNRPNVFRLNISATAEEFRSWTGREPGKPTADDVPDAVDPGAEDVVIAHPVYGGLAWLAVVSPGPRTDDPVRELLRSAHRRARERHQRRREASP